MMAHRLGSVRAFGLEAEYAFDPANLAPSMNALSASAMEYVLGGQGHKRGSHVSVRAHSGLR
jgi:hypothetical protein